MSIALSDGARIVIRDWLRLKPGESLSILSDELHTVEALELRDQAAAAGASPILVIVPSGSPQSGELFDQRCVAFLEADAILGATHNSIMTTRAIHDAVRTGSRFLSLPLATNDGLSLLTSDMMTMDPARAELLAARVKPFLASARMVHVTTEAGTDLKFTVQNRSWNLFSGVCDTKSVSTSVSFEISVSLVEDRTEGVLVLDGSMGYIGLVDAPIRLRYESGRLVDMETNRSGRQLADYLKTFSDERMFVAGELGIGLNEKAQCAGNSYIEDESAYGTFHIGMGRNIALGGKHYANGHFDLVAFRPDIYIDDIKIMERGELLQHQ